MSNRQISAVMANLNARFDLAKLVSPKKKKVALRAVPSRLSAEAALYRQSLDMVRVLRREVSAAYASIAQAQERLTSDAPYIEVIIDRVRAALQRVALTVGLAAGRLLSAEAARHDDKWVASVKSATGIDIGPIISASDIAKAVDDASQLFSSSLQGVIDEIGQKIRAKSAYYAYGQANKSDLDKSILEITGFSRKKLALISITTINQINGKLNEIRQTQAGIKRYTWATKRDKRVRPKHRAREGQIFRWDTPPDGGHPGSEPRCRCVAVPYFDRDEAATIRSERKRASSEGRRAVERALMSFAP